MDDADNVTREIRQLGEQGRKWVIERRRHYHAHPELSLEEARTAADIASDLSSMGIGPDDTLSSADDGMHAVVATIRGTASDAYCQGRPRRRLLMRADIDALPVAEKTGLPFSSESEGVMHACGHDFHIATLLGAARILSRMADELHGEVRLVFQPAEEIARGARGMIDRGVLEGVDGVFAEHVWSDVDPGTVSVEAGPRMAAVDWWRIDVHGRSAHAAMPDTGADAIVAAAAMVGELQTIVSRDVSPFEAAVVTIGQIGGGTARNVIADHAWLTGTTRCFSPETRERIPELMRGVVEDVAAAHGCSGEVSSYGDGHAAVINDPGASRLAREAAEKVLGKDAVSTYRGTMAGEDFSEYLGRVPGVLALVGSGTADESGVTWPQHSCRYSPDEGALLRGTLLAAQYATDFLAQ